MKKRSTLVLKELPLILRTAVLIIFFATLGMLIVSYFERIENYKKLGTSYARAAAKYIDGDRIRGYIETGEKDEYYQDVLDFMEAVRSECGLKFYSVYVPNEKGEVYVWDTAFDGQAFDLGQFKEYGKGSREYAEKVFKKDPSYEILIRESTKGEFIAVSYYPIFDSSGEPVALACAVLDMVKLVEYVFKNVLILVICVVVILIFTMNALYRSFQKNIIMPILKVNTAAREMIDNLDKKDVSIEVNTGDELEELAESFNKMNHDMREYLKSLVEVTADKERIGTELSVAARIQAEMLPCDFPAFPDRKEFDIFASMTPAKEVGGDFYDFFLLDEDHLCMVMADVSEKGVPAALFMVISKTLIMDQAQLCSSPKMILEDVNDKLYVNNEEGMFVTVWLGILEISTGRIVAANAGHEYPAMRKAGGDFELVMDEHGMVLGAMPDMKYTEYEMKLEKGGCLFLYTDGVPEATDANSKLFGTDRMIEALNIDPQAAPKDLLMNVKKATDEFVGEAPQFDDLTMLAVVLK